jgi:hypothetical protein
LLFALILIPSLTSFRFVLYIFQFLLMSLSFASLAAFNWISHLSQLLLESLPVAYYTSLTYFSHLFQLLLAFLAFVSRSVFVAFRTSLSCL